MYIDIIPNRTSPPAVLLRESYRFEGKVHKRTLLNISDWPPELIQNFRTLLKGGTAIPADKEALTITRSLPHGPVAVVIGTLRKIGLDWLLGPTSVNRGGEPLPGPGGGDDHESHHCAGFETGDGQEP